MAKNRLVGRLFIILVLTIVIAGCKDTKKQKALVEELAQAKAEAVKLKAEAVQLKSEISYLNEKLVAANLARDNTQIQLSQIIEDSNTTITEADTFQQENIKLRKLLAEQIKKNNELEKQIETLKAAIRVIQTRIEPNRISVPTPNSVEEIPAVNQPAIQ
jgi:chromosome segregation ATPase